MAALLMRPTMAVLLQQVADYIEQQNICVGLDKMASAPAARQSSASSGYAVRIKTYLSLNMELDAIQRWLDAQKPAVPDRFSV